ncbi:MAG TPA: SMI1/KNR4 family protein [Chitinophaga sp.]|uniref:SMI1/KNR4 family protein n=1 Tax=Chitinophaga sp. TaxID=1869181 RepID=UPI002BBF066E|nr:SMI1/KNR4 family protein [Chitinophaga sp.]HVI48352.1 SMI1/KNR4 family protein [Chitinophaga sp.]
MTELHTGMQEFKEQIQRIKDKLTKAGKADRKRKVFGANSHQYKINQPVSLHEVTDFETRCNVTLPDCFKAFLLEIGNGGPSHENSAAGPFYGIYPLGENTGELLENGEQYFASPAKLHPGISKTEWEELTKQLNSDDITDEDYEKERGRLYGGILPIGSQGCTYLHGLMLNGPHTGKVVNLDLDMQQPQFTYEANFLDWYERWLDEILSGDLLADGPSWFGYNIGGSVTVLLEKYHATAQMADKQTCIYGILNKRLVEREEILRFEQAYLAAPEALKKPWLQTLSKFNYAIAQPHLSAYCDVDLLTVLQCVHWYAKDKSRDWQDVISSRMHTIDNDETFTFGMYLLEKAKASYGDLITPMAAHSNERIRATTMYSLGKLKNKSVYTNVFIRGLQDTCNRVILYALQALSGIRNKRLLPVYKQLQERFPVEEDYILSNLKQRLSEYKMTMEDLRQMTFSEEK